MKDGPLYLNKLNDTLHQIEKEMVAKAKVCLKIAERKWQASNTFTTDYEVEVDVAFFIKKWMILFIYLKNVLNMKT